MTKNTRRLSYAHQSHKSLSAVWQTSAPRPGTARTFYPSSSSAASDLEYVFGVAHEMRGMVERVGTFDLLKGKILANLFYEPSTRTSSSFTAAMERLGGSVIPINEVKYSSVSKGESLPDTVRTLECYADVIVLRHPETGSAAIAAKAAQQARHQRGRRRGRTSHAGAARYVHDHGGTWARLDNLTVTMLGDLKYGRTVHSLARLLSQFNGIKLNYVSPDILKMPKEVMDEVAEKGSSAG